MLAWWGLGCGTSSDDGRGPTDGPEPTPGEEELPPNVLVIMLDDLGTEMLGIYGEVEEAEQPPTPHIDDLAARGIRFDNAYASAICSPSRAMMQTGRLSRRTLVGDAIYPLNHVPSSPEDFEMSLDEVTIPEMLDLAPEPWDTALIGKWHLTTFHSENALGNPGLQGYDHHSGMMGNLMFSYTLNERVGDFYDWEKDDNGTIVHMDRYAPTVLVDEALAHIAQQPSPWFTFVSFNTPHPPFHVPPSELHGFEGLDESSSDGLKYRAMVQAADAEIGRLLSTIDPDTMERTLVILLADNGSRTEVLWPPFDPVRAKGTMYDGGVRVPFIVAGPLVDAPGTSSDALIHVVDLFPTLAELAGVDVATVQGANGEPVVLDGISILPWIRDPDLPSGRDLLYTERFEENGVGPYHTEVQMVRDTNHKLIRRNEGPDELYDMRTRGLDEGDDLLQGPLDEEAQAAFEHLDEAMRRILDELE
jgi:arylsulfatase A-like enzyme